MSEHPFNGAPLTWVWRCKFREIKSFKFGNGFYGGKTFLFWETTLLVDWMYSMKMWLPPFPSTYFIDKLLFVSNTGQNFRLCGKPQVTNWQFSLPRQKKNTAAWTVPHTWAGSFSPQGDLYLQNPMVLLWLINFISTEEKGPCQLKLKARRLLFKC